MVSPSASRAKVASTSASQAHSSSIWLGASTKSHSVATPEKRTHSVRPASTWCTRWPNSWKSVTTSSCSIRPRLKLQTSTPSASLAAGDSTREVELRRVLVLPVARVQVEVDAADALAVEGDVVGRDLLVPRAGVLPGHR